MPYSVVNTILDAGFPVGALSYWKSSFLSELSDAAIDTAVEQFANCLSSPMSVIVLEHLHGAATRVAPEATAVPYRSEGYNFLAVSEWMDPATTDENVAWARRGVRVHAAVHRQPAALHELPGRGRHAGATRRAPPTAPITTGSCRSRTPTTPATSSA